MGHCLCLVVDPHRLADAEPTVSTWVRRSLGVMHGWKGQSDSTEREYWNKPGYPAVL